jgi:hypothetical protein
VGLGKLLIYISSRLILANVICAQGNRPSQSTVQQLGRHDGQLTAAGSICDVMRNEFGPSALKE